MRKLDIFDMASVIRDAFGDFAAANEAERKQEIELYKEQWRPGRLLEEKLVEVNAHYDLLRKEKRDSLIEEFDEEFEKVVSQTKGKVLAVDSGVARYLRDLGDYPVTAVEYNILLSKYANVSYWGDKVLQDIARRNNIAYPADVFDPDAATVIDALTELRGRVVRYLDEAGSGTYSELDALHPSQLKKIEDRLTRGTDPQFSAEGKARRILTEIAEYRDVFRQSQAIRNVLATVADDVREQVLFGLEAGWSNILDDALRLSGASEKIDMAGKKNIEDMKKTRIAIDKLRALDPADWYSASRVLAEAGGAGNLRLAAAVRENFPDNSDFQNVVDIMAGDSTNV